MMSESTHAQVQAGTLPSPAPLTVIVPDGAAATPVAGSAPRVLDLGSRIGLATLALWLFLAAIQVMKTGAAALAPQLNGSPLTDSLTSTLGFGWLSAMLVMSGSPVAASSLALLNGGAVSTDGAFMMLTGSRLGAAFVVLMVAFVYALRGQGQRATRKASLSIGIFALVMTAIVYVPALLIGVPLLHTDAMNTLANASPVKAFNVIKMVTDPVVGAVSGLVPGNVLFFAGLVLLLVSIRMVDRVLPQAHVDTLEEHVDWRSRKWVMFGLGSLVALVTMSVSVALTMLVPAVAKGYFRRRHTIPYIMGANITTLGDTLLTAMVVGNPDGVRVVLSELAGIVVVTVLLLAFVYTPMTERLVQFTDAVLASRRRLAVFVTAMFCVPMSLIWLVS